MSNAAGGTLTQNVVVQTQAPPVQGDGLKQTLGYLRAIEAAMKRIGQRAGGVAPLPDMETIRKRVQAFGKDLNLGNIMQSFDVFDPKVVERGLARYAQWFETTYKRKMSSVVKGFGLGGGLMPRGEFVSPKPAAEAVRFVLAERQKMEQRGMASVFGVGMRTIPMLKGADPFQPVAGHPNMIPVLKVRGDQIVAELVTPPFVKLKVPGSAIQGSGATGSGGGKAPPGASPQWVPGTQIEIGPGAIRSGSRTNAFGENFRWVEEAVGNTTRKTTRQTAEGNVTSITERLAAAVKQQADEALRDAGLFVRVAKDATRHVSNRAKALESLGNQYAQIAQKLEFDLNSGLAGRLTETGQASVLSAVQRRIAALRSASQTSLRGSEVEAAARRDRATELRLQRRRHREQQAPARDLVKEIVTDAKEAMRQARHEIQMALDSVRGDTNKARVANRMTGAYAGAADRLEGLLQGGFGRNLSGAGQSAVASEMARYVEALRAKANAALRVGRRQVFDGEESARQQELALKADREFARLKQEAVRDLHALRLRSLRTKDMNWTDRSAMADEYAAIAARLAAGAAGAIPGFTRRHAESIEKIRAGAEFQEAKMRIKAAPPVLRPPEPPKPSFLSTTLGKATKMAGWAALAVPEYFAINAFYSTLGNAVPKMMEMSYQTARLSQVFRGVGGTTRQLARDVMDLAAKEGQATDKAMESAISWSRLGLSRQQVAEAVRVSLQASNVAELDSMEATQQLQSVMMAYGLRVDELAGLLGKLNSVSNTLNVTNADLLTGLTKSASVARQMGMPIETLVGMIGAGASAGQTGAQMGNALKTFMVRIMDPVRQERLRKELGVEVRTTAGIKSGDAIFADLASRWQTMSGQERGRLQNLIAGATQGNRLAITLENYTTAAVQAVNAGLNLQSAEREDAKIKREAKSRVEAVSAAWDKLLFQLDEVFQVTESVAAGARVATSAMNILGSAMNLSGKTQPGFVMDVASRLFGPKMFASWASAFEATFAALEGSAGQPLASRMGGAAQAFGGGYLSDLASKTGIDQMQRIMERGQAMSRAAELLRRAQERPPSRDRAGSVIGDLAQLSPEVIGNAEQFRKTLGLASGSGLWSSALEPYIQRANQQANRARGSAEALGEAAEKVIRESTSTLPEGTNARQKADERLKNLQRLRSLSASEDALDQQAISAAMERTKYVLDEVVTRYRGLVQSGATRLEIERKILETQMAAVYAEERRAPEGSDYRRGLTMQREELQARFDAVSSPQAARADALGRALTLAGEIARIEAESQVRGATEIARLKSHEAILVRMLGARKALAGASQDAMQTANAEAQVLALQASLEETRLQLLRQRATAAREENEYRRSALVADSETILRRAFADRMTQGGMPGLTQFFSMSDRMRSEMMQTMESRERRRFLKQSWAPEEIQGGILGADVMSTAAGAAAAAASELNQLRDASTRAARSVGALAVRVDAMAESVDRAIRRFNGTPEAPGSAPRLAQAP